MSITKIIDDTLKSPEGKWSRKSLTMLTSFVVSIILGSYITFCNYFTKTAVAENAIDVFYGFLLLSGGTSFMTVYEKLKNKLAPKGE
jgi:hypothetical protein